MRQTVSPNPPPFHAVYGGGLQQYRNNFPCDKDAYVNMQHKTQARYVYTRRRCMCCKTVFLMPHCGIG